MFTTQMECISMEFLIIIVYIPLSYRTIEKFEEYMLVKLFNSCHGVLCTAKSLIISYKKVMLDGGS
jgi:hypothetical protein